MERSDALILLTTNLPRNIDDAFLRRIHVSVDFRLPEEEERRLIWRRAFPADCPTGAIDIAWLAAKFPVAGGPITSTALAAAFLAASEGVTVSMTHVVKALRGEMRKVGRLINESELAGWDGGTA